MLLLLALASAALGAGVPEGWRMKDRFAGFRFECRGRFDREEWAVQVREYADELSAFGWVQLSPAGTVVGEFRGTKQVGPWMRDFLDTGPDDTAGEYSCDIKTYADTKIRFHFSHFKVLDARRHTCFPEPPHACRDGRAEEA